MNQTMNEMFKKDLPNTFEWCEEYAARTGVRIYAGNPPVALILESVMGQVKELKQALERHSFILAELLKDAEALKAPQEQPKKDKTKKGTEHVE